MFRPTLGVFALIVVATAHRSFINKCAISDPNIEQCVVKNANLAIEVLNYGVPELDLPSMVGFDVGDLFFSLGEDLSFLLEDIKSYPIGIRVHNARLKFAPNKELKAIELFFKLDDVTWKSKYQAIGFADNRKIKEKGSAQINLGKYSGNYTLEFKRIKANGLTYLKPRNPQAKITFDKFEFLSNDVKAVGAPLLKEQFNPLRTAVMDKALEISKDIVTFSFTQILEEIPERELFLN